MKIQYCSDLHLEFDQNSNYLLNKPLTVKGEILVLAGDIIPLHDELFKHPFFNFVSDHYENVFWVPGNHEFYHKDLAEFTSSFNIKIRSNVNVLNNIEMDFKNIHFVFSTLWTHIGTRNKTIIEQGVADFECILNKDKKIKASDYNSLHHNSLSFIKQSLSKPKDKTVVVTHHLPSILCNSSFHADSLINEAFCVDLSDYIKECGANFWVYGHSHFNQKPLYIGNTILLTNQLGYVHCNEHRNFNNNAFFSI